MISLWQIVCVLATGLSHVECILMPYHVTGGDAHRRHTAGDAKRFLDELSRRSDTRISFRECLVPEGQRLDCGFHGIDEEGCYARECCWGETHASGVPWCYHSKPTMTGGCLMNTDVRVECGWYGIRKEQCLAKECCWRPSSEPSAPWCFHATRVPVHEGECGVPAIQPKTSVRIVGGDDAVPHSWPWMVSLQKESGHFCGATLVNSQWVVSAAHCEPGLFGSSEPSVVVGLHSLSNSDASQQRILIEEAFSHEDYQSNGRYDHDFMLIKLAEPVTFSDEVSPACLPEPMEELNDGHWCYSTGWGTTSSGGSSPDVLQQVALPVINIDTCNQDGWYNGRLDDTMVCAGFEEGGRDSCQGDSGGPLVCYHDDTWKLYGVVSWGDGCAFENKPGLYAKTSQFITWMENTIRDN